MFTIHLDNLKFYSYHGLHDEESILGNEYIVNIDIEFKEDKKITSIHETINYVSIYSLIKEQMQKPTALLETLAQNIVDEIKKVDPRITSIVFNIRKMNSPIEAFRGNVGVTLAVKI
ncbi:dihydroneopterin aldolase [Ferruginibacter albus]|uniref:dihydroneopterin aldolase n=1 Tax=Ferruginibacter albus TaxID=2875540 RepID=UPI001CC36EB4|nr:dihydroneopterin aldolase [Ferruginibacter albus]UAY50717.1 dihydroneopterin aldolase [Ferruginibacter albus]